MEISFSKYQGTGNDFVLIDNRTRQIDSLDQLTVSTLCNRRFGIGADGLMLLQEKPGYDFEMIYYNADGKPGSLCGNGGRCVVAFAKQLGIVNDETTFLAVDGPHHAKITADGRFISLQMADVDVIRRDGEAWVLDTGSPHFVLSAAGVHQKDVYTEGRAIRYSDAYTAEGINVNFVEAFDDHYFVRTYERGVEDETYACGTGVTAVALAMAMQNKQTGANHTQIRVPGGNLSVRFEYDGQTFSNIFLEGPAAFVYHGAIQV